MKAKAKKKQKQQNKKKQITMNVSLEPSNSGASIDSGVIESNEWVEEMSCFYVDPITGEIQRISIDQDKQIYENKLKERYITDYGISEEAFNLTQSFFNEYQEDYSLCINMLKKIIVEAIKRRSDISATEQDISRFLDCIDTDSDGKINLREFFQLLLLFLSKKSTLEKRLEGILLEQSYSHETEGYLTLSEAQNFNNFLQRFYGKPKCQHTNEEFISKLYHLNSPLIEAKIDYEEVTYNYYAREVYENFNEMCFVK